MSQYGKRDIMKKISIIYWSEYGNVELLATKIAEGAKAAGAEVVLKRVQEATIEDVTSADAVAFGSPSMDNNQVEQTEMEPFLKEFKLLPNNNKNVVLFGSFGWDDGAFMVNFKNIMADYNFNVIGDVTVKETPSEVELKKAEELGALLAK